MLFWFKFPSDRLGSCCLNNSEWVVSVYECVALCYVHKQQFAIAYTCLPFKDVAKYQDWVEQEKFKNLSFD